MLEFYTDEFKEKANKQIKDVSNLFEYMLPNIEKWQMRGCMVLGKDLTTYYIPIKNEDERQIGTKITIFNKITGETHLIVSLEESLKYKRTTIEGEVETYNVSLENNKVSLKNIFTFDKDLIVYMETLENGKITLDVSSNLGKDMFESCLKEIGFSKRIESIKEIYFNQKTKMPRVRKMD